MPTGTHGGVSVQGSTTVFDVPAYTQAGTSASVIDMTSSSVSVTTTYGGTGMLNLDIEVLFDEHGAEVSGTFLEYVPRWRCASFEVPQSQCAAAHINCILGVIGGTLASLGTCLDPANWVEGRMAARRRGQQRARARTAWICARTIPGGAGTRQPFVT